MLRSDPTRSTAYTERGIKRVECAHPGCKRQSVHQWSVSLCAAGNRRVWRPFCLEHDIALNRLMLEFAGIDNADQLMAAYTDT